MSLRPLLPRGRDRVPVALAWLAGIVALLALLQRFRYAVDFSDETFSIAFPYRYVLGDKPFVDEISIQQTSGILLYPFVWLFVKLTGGSTYLVLYVRAIHFFVFKGLAGFAVWLAARRLLRFRSSAIAVAFTPLVFVPHSIPNVGYNVVGFTLLIAGTFFAIAAINELGERRARQLYFASGLSLGLMSFAYPPMAIAAVLEAPLVFLCASRKRLVSTGIFIAGGIASVIAVFPALAFGGVAGIQRSLGWGIQSGSSHGSQRAMSMFEAYWRELPPVFLYVTIALLVAALVRSRVLTAATVIGTLAALFLWYRSDVGVNATMRFITYGGTLAPLMVVVAQPDKALVRSAALVILPSFAAAAVATVFSTQNLDAAALGFHASLVLVTILAGRAFERVDVGPAFAMIPAFAVMLALVERAWDFVYRDGPLASLTATVAAGPFKGIKTTPDRVQMLAELRDITRRFDRPDGHILILYEAPGFYLQSRMRPSAHCVWEASFGDLEGMMSTFRRKANGNGIVLRIKGTPHTAVDAELTPPERKIDETKHFIVYRDG